MWGWLLLASSGVASVPLPGAPAVFRGVSCSWLPLAGSATFWLLLPSLILRWTFVVGLAVSWYTTWFSTLCLRSLPSAGSATFLAPVCWPTPAVEPCCWVGGWFSTLCRGACSLRRFPCSKFPWGFSAFSVTGCLSFCYPGGIGCPATLLFFFLCFYCSSWLAGVHWVLHPVSGCSSWGCVCSLGDSIITLLAFPYLRVGELLGCGVYGVG